MIEILLILVVNGGVLELERWDARDDGKASCEGMMRILEHEAKVYDNTWTKEDDTDNGIHYACVPTYRKSR